MLRTPVLAAVITTAALSVTLAHAQEKIRPFDCPEGVVQQAECGQLTVPMYYNSTNDKTIDVGFVRIPAENPTAKRGTLFFNPGGPGGSIYISMTVDKYNEIPAELRAEWDLVGVQVRGQEYSTPLVCDDTSNIGMFDKLTNNGGTIRQACEKHTPGYTASLTTENFARDWDEVRKAMGLERISIYGLSYGTQLASVYATLFPQQTDKVVLDSGYDQSTNGEEQIPKTIAVTHEFFNWVARNNDRFKLGATGKEVYDKWAAIVEAESGAPPTLPSPNGKGNLAVFEAELKNASNQLTKGTNQRKSPTFNRTLGLMMRNHNWHKAAKLINGELSVADLEAESSSQPRRSSANTGNIFSIVTCNEKTSTDNSWLIPNVIWTSFTGDILSQRYGLAAGIACKGAPPVTNFPTITGDNLNHQPLQIQALGDPVATYESGMVMHQKMGSHLITVDNTNHGHLDNPTAQQAVVEYLRTGKTDVTTIPQPELPLD